MYQLAKTTTKGTVELLILILVCLSVACSRTDQPDVSVREYPATAWSLDSYQGKPPSHHTTKQLQRFAAEVPMSDFKDGTSIRDHAREQLLSKLPESLGGVDFTMPSVNEVVSDAPVHPSLKGIGEQMAETQGLFKLTEGIYQIRGGLAYITLLRGNTGWIVLDTGLTQEFASDAWEFARQFLPGGADVPGSAVVYSHSHVDHFGGVKGLVSEEQVIAGEVEVIAPYGFMAHALAENLIAGGAMFRRADYHFGTLLEQKSDGTEYFSFVPSETGALSLIRPTHELPQGPGEVTSLEVDGVQIDFMDVSGAEAPAATLIYLPSEQMIFNSELVFQGQHNIYTLRGAQVRDALNWSKLINQVIHNWGSEVECITGPHGPSFCGNAQINEYLRVQRDNYGFVHNQTVRLFNSGTKLQDAGQTIEEIVPESLSALWHTHGYHGTYSHNARGVVNRYLGFYDGNPSNLNPLPLREEASKYVDYMGGADAIMASANADFQNGEYRFVASVLGKLVTDQPDYWPARHLLADTLEQLGYQAEGPQWRNAYLSAAKELRVGHVLTPSKKNSIDGLFSAVSPEELFDSLAVRVDSTKVAKKDLTFLVTLTDRQEMWWLELKHGNLSSILIREHKKADAELSLPYTALVKIATGQAGLKEMLEMGLASIDGSLLAVGSLLLSLEASDSNFQIVGG